MTTTLEPDLALPAWSTGWPPRVDMFGVQMTPTTYAEATKSILAAARDGRQSVVSCFAVHALITACSDRQLCAMVNRFDMITPDGQPVRWALNLLYGTRLTDRVYGPDLMLAVCRAAAEQQVSIYFYGGSPAVVEQLRDNLCQQFPALQVAGYESPPFRPLTPREDEEMVRRVNESGAGIVFIGLGCPKQDVFAFEHRRQLKAVQVCVGAAFDFHAGAKSTAPAWMQRHGLEWLYRLIQEPRRLWRRYLVTNTSYLLRLTAALANLPGVRRRRLRWRMLATQHARQRSR